MSLPAFRKIDFLPINLAVEHRQDGAMILRNENPMGSPPPHLLEPFARHAKEIPNRIWLAERPDGEAKRGVWHELTYGEAWEKVSALAAALAARGMGEGKDLVILSGNSISHALMAYSAMLTGAASAPVSEAWSLMSSDYAKLHHAIDLIRPAFVFVENYPRYAKAIEAVIADKDITLIVAGEGAPKGALQFEDLLNGAENGAAALYDALDSSMVGKYLFTSGSTAMPKAVINTHRMMCLNAVMAEKLICKKEDDPSPCLLSWLPWNHTFGGNSVMNNLLVAGGTIYIDRGRPLPGRFEETIFNLHEIAPTNYSGVPVTYGWLIKALEEDEGLAKNFFSRLRNVSYGGAALGQEIADRFQKIAIKTTGERILFTSGYGATETAPGIMTVHWETEQMGLLGLPLPGVEIKLQPTGSKLEVRVRGECIMPGYYRDEKKTKEAFDEEGFYKLGDAAKFVDPDDPTKGLVFDGRVVEDFKLASGVWVSAGPLRLAAIDAATPLIRDAVIAGLDEDYIAILAFPDLAACAELTGHEVGADPQAILSHPALAERLAEAFAIYNKKQRGSSTRIERVLLMHEPPSIDKSEITDKGYINQAAVLSARAADVARLYAKSPDEDIIIAAQG